MRNPSPSVSTSTWFWFNGIQTPSVSCLQRLVFVPALGPLSVLSREWTWLGMANQVLQDQSDVDWGRQSDVEETPAPGTPEAARYRPPHRRGSRTPPTPNMWQPAIDPDPVPALPTSLSPWRPLLLETQKRLSDDIEQLKSKIRQMER